MPLSKPPTLPAHWQAGDVLFFSGRDWISRFIQLVTLPAWTFVVALVLLLAPLANPLNPRPIHPWASTGAAIAWWGMAFLGSPKISHVGIIAEANGALWLFESTTLVHKPCGILGREVNGVQAHNPDGFRLKEYAGSVWMLRLNEDRELNPTESAGLSVMVMRKLGQPYNALGAIVSGTRFTKIWWTPRAVAHGFCSQVVSYWLKCLNRFPDDVMSSSVHPNGLWRVLIAGESFEDEPRRVK